MLELARIHGRIGRRHGFFRILARDQWMRAPGCAHRELTSGILKRRGRDQLGELAHDPADTSQVTTGDLSANAGQILEVRY